MSARSLPAVTNNIVANMAKPAKAAGSLSASSPELTRKASAQKLAKKPNDYTSEGVKDHDIFLLPATDYQYMILVTFMGAVVRLFRIYQPSSVVFDEVQ